ncbi:MAG: metallophosphoesterase [Lentisphaeria bacterium]|nr:metallophosphoesterase [Lentisphaeria bacterium]
MKKILIFMAVFIAFCPLYARKAVIKKDSFYAVFHKEFQMQDAQKSSLSGSVAGKKHFFTLPENSVFDLKKLCGKYIPRKDAAIVSFVVNASSDGKYFLGVAADYWITAYHKGKLIGTTEPKGEGTSLISPLNRSWEVFLHKGDNRIFCHTRPGVSSWNIAAGVLPDISAWPEKQEDRKYFFKKVFPDELKISGPFVTKVTPESARIILHTSQPFALGLRYRETGGNNTEKNVVPEIVYGRYPQKNIHSFELKNLKGDKEYLFECYRLDLLKNTFCSGKFRTLPDKGVTHTFAAISDTQVSGMKRWEIMKNLAEKGIFKQTSLFISLGDVANGLDDFEYEYFQSFLSPLAEREKFLPYYSVRGNHEYRGRDTDKYTQYFSCPYYAFRYGDVLYIVLDTGEDKERQKKDLHYTLLTDTEEYFKEQKKFLERLAASPVCKNARKRIVLAHAPPFEWESLYYANQIASFASVFYGENPLIPIDLWLCGDIHSPYRYDPVTKELSGAERRLHRKRPGKMTANDLKRIHFPVFVNDGTGGAGGNYSVTKVKVTNAALFLTCIGENGKILDDIIIRKGKKIEIKESTFTKYIPWKEKK